ncbi:hypothetical protein [Limosilactobacillus fermentum]|uniref:hypothetical protein n=1 Tax=Limosilactobacillus fermentum TaxID=1613 RepID=UPI00128DE498|nr:hypothetical protein [Limosilactobacillus fermentum]MPW03135.1 hypothetical protein [Limosilactobacillus fermentum]
MEHQVSISVSKQPHPGVVSFKRITIRERILRWLLGSPSHLMVIAPGDCVKQLRIQTLTEETNHEQN